MKPLHFPSQQYQCIQCGKSCGQWRIWVEPQLLPSLREHPLALRLQVAGSAYLIPQEGGWHALGYDQQGRCFFLTENGRLCGLHASSGWRAKPRACRQFPFFLLETPDGIQVGLSFRCSAVQQNRGIQWSEHQSDLQSLLEDGHYPRVGFDGPVGWSTYLEWEQAWLEALDRGEPLEKIFFGHLREWIGLDLGADGFARLLDRWTRQALELLRQPGGEELPLVGSNEQSVRYFRHVLERKSLWLGADFLGRMSLLLIGERLLAWAYQRFEDWGAAFDLVEGEWLAHRDDLGPVELGMATMLRSLCR